MNRVLDVRLDCEQALQFETMRRSAAIYSLVAIECIIWVTLIASPSADATPIGERWVGEER